MQSNYIVLVIIGVIALIIIHLIRILIEKIKTLIGAIPPELKTKTPGITFQDKIKKYFEAKPALKKMHQSKKFDLKALGLGRLIPTIKSTLTVFVAIITLIVIIIILSTIDVSYGITAKDIITRTDQKIRGRSSYSKATMIITRPKWTRKMTMDAWAKGTKRVLIRIVSPAKNKGVGTLKINNEMWNYLPRIEQIIKVPPSMMLQSWMGSDFTNDDLVRESSIVYDYTHKLGKDETINKHSCYKIILTPKPKAPVVWGKIEAWVRKKDYLPVKYEFYNEKQKLIKIMTFSNFKWFHDRTYPGQFSMSTVAKKGYKTSLIFHFIKFNIGLSNNIFTLRNLKKVK